jgi:hypothetical protein
MLEEINETFRTVNQIRSVIQAQDPAAAAPSGKEEADAGAAAAAQPAPREPFMELPHWRFPIGDDGKPKTGLLETLPMNFDKVLDGIERVFDKRTRNMKDENDELERRVRLEAMRGGGGAPALPQGGNGAAPAPPAQSIPRGGSLLDDVSDPN